MYLLVLAQQKRLPATVSITADTGWEQDRLMSTGERTTADEYFRRVVEPLAHEAGIRAYMVRAENRNGEPMPDLWSWTKQHIAAGKLSHLKIPLFGSNGGRLRQACTSRMKVAAIRQQARRLGATSLRTAQGIHAGELHRVKGLKPRVEGGFWTYNDAEKGKPVKWASHYYPLVDLWLNRQQVREALEHEGIPYLLSSECDGCPHKDAARWARTAPAVIDEIADVEALMGGQFFFTDRRVPLKEAIARWSAEADARAAAGQISWLEEEDFTCATDICGV